VLTERHKEIAGKIWEIANRLRGPYRPPQYRLVMLPMIVLRRLDCVLEPTKDAVLAEYARLTAAGTPENAIPRLLTRAVDKDRKQPLYNISAYTFAKLLGDSENIAPNLVAYINGFSDSARAIFDKFKFGDQIEKLDSSIRALVAFSGTVEELRRRSTGSPARRGSSESPSGFSFALERRAAVNVPAMFSRVNEGSVAGQPPRAGFDCGVRRATFGCGRQLPLLAQFGPSDRLPISHKAR
jgi:hypothetical protein